eukprot:UN11837
MCCAKKYHALNIIEIKQNILILIITDFLEITHIVTV